MSTFNLGSPIPVEGTSFMGCIDGEGTIIPYEFTNWRDEVSSWVESAYLGAAVADILPYSIKGPGVIDFLKKYTVNNYDKAPIGKSKHAIMLTELGTICADGIALRLSEDEWLTSCLYPMIDFWLQKEHEQGNFLDVEGELLSGKQVMYQVGGPKSLEILEAASQQDLHDIEFLRCGYATIAGQRVMILRLGMAGTLSYEVHCPAEHCNDVYNAILEAGNEFGIKRLGFHAYMMNHTEDGFPQCGLHFYWDYRGLPGFHEWMMANIPWFEPITICPENLGSYPDNVEAFYVSPYDIGWGNVVNYGHDFVGKEAALAKKNSVHREMVTLEWNADDIADVFRSQFAGGTPYMPMDEVNDYFAFLTVYAPQVADKVLDANGNLIGISSGRVQNAHYNVMLSLCMIDPAFAQEGTEVTVVWGNENYPQKEIRARVAKFPYLRMPSNGEFDVNSIPRRFDAKN